jgi:hypothetical protein
MKDYEHTQNLRLEEAYTSCVQFPKISLRAVDRCALLAIFQQLAVLSHCDKDYSRLNSRGLIKIKGRKNLDVDLPSSSVLSPSSVSELISVLSTFEFSLKSKRIRIIPFKIREIPEEKDDTELLLFTTACSLISYMSGSMVNIKMKQQNTSR